VRRQLNSGHGDEAQLPLEKGLLLHAQAVQEEDDGERWRNRAEASIAVKIGEQRRSDNAQRAENGAKGDIDPKQVCALIVTDRGALNDGGREPSGRKYVEEARDDRHHGHESKVAGAQEAGKDRDGYDA
jgi:hypothetical protein